MWTTMAAFSLSISFSEIRRRHVFGLLALYVVGAGALIQAADLAFPGLAIPEYSIRYVWIGAILGLPIAAVFGWRFDITTDGIRRTPSVLEDPTNVSLRISDYVVLSVLSTATIAMVVTLTQKVVATQGQFEPANAVADVGEFDPPENSIAVLPFANLSSDPEQEYFVAGMQDSLISELARISNLIVISRTSTLHYKDTQLTIPDIARELNVSTVVEGSVFKSGDQIRIEIQLVATHPEKHLLAQSYPGELSRVLELQREVTQDVAEKIRVSLTEQEKSRFVDVRSVNPQAYESYLKGRFFTDQFNPESMDRAIAYLEQAVTLDPEDPLPYAGLAIAYLWGGVGHGKIPKEVAFSRARKALDKALQIDSTIAEAHMAFGFLSLWSWDWITAEQELRRAIILKPNSADAHHGLATYLQAIQRHDEAIHEIYLASKLDPLRPIILADFAVNLFADGQYSRAIGEANKALELDPDFAPALWILGESYLQEEMADNAIEAFERAFAIQPGFIFDLAQAYARVGRIDEARAIIDAASSDMKLIAAPKIAEVLVEFGEFDRAFEMLEIGYEERMPWLFTIRYDPVFDDLRADPRYDDLIRRMNFPE